MKNQRILENNQINWHKEDSTRLSYEMIFNDGESIKTETITEKKKEEPPKAEVELQLNEVLQERDEKWKIKVKKTKEAALAEGFEQGRQQGLEEARTEIEEKIQFVNTTIQAGLDEWKKRQELLDPGLLDVAFEIAEAILGVPIDQTEIRKSLELSLGPILERIDDQSKPVLLVAESDFEYIKELKKEYAPKTFLKVRVDEACQPGEFKFESTEEVVIHNTKNALQEFRKELSVPSWK